MISVVSLPSNIFQYASSSQQQGEDEASESSLSAQPSNESDTIQCITTPCEFPSPKPMPPEPDIDNTRVISSNESKSDKAMQNNSSQSEPCISPCLSGQI